MGELASWYREDPRAGRYTEIRSALEAAAGRADALGLPSAPLLTKLKEGASKRAAPDRLARAFELELERLISASRVILDSGLSGYAESRSDAVYGWIVLYLAGGVTEETLTALAAAIDPPDPGRLFALWDFILDAVSIYSLDSLDDESLLLLGTAAASSGLPEKSLASLSSLFLKGRVAGIDAGEMIAITVRTLGSGGGIIGIDREIERRRPPR